MNAQQNSGYVILRHVTPDGVHFDLMLETDGVLSTWRIDIGPDELKTAAAVQAVKIFDHDLKFLTYEGPVNKGTASVTTADKGTYSIISQTADELQIKINAEVLCGIYTLARETKSIWEFAAWQKTFDG